MTTRQLPTARGAAASRMRNLMKTAVFAILLGAVMALFFIILHVTQINIQPASFSETGRGGAHDRMPPASNIHGQARAVESPYGVSGGFWILDIPYKFPEPEPRFRWELGIIPFWMSPWRKQCLDHARDLDEPFNDIYLPRRRTKGFNQARSSAAGRSREQEEHGILPNDWNWSQVSQRVIERQEGDFEAKPILPEDFPGGAPRALYRWDSGTISRQQFDAVPHWLRNG